MPSPPAPAAAPVTPPLSATDFVNQDDAQWAATLGIPTESPREEAAVPTPDPVSPPPAVSTEPVDTALAEAAETVEETPEETPPPEPKKLLTEFAVYDPSGEVEIPELTIKFKAKGQDRELPLDHVVRMAQFGFANKEREEQVVASKTYVAEVQQQNTHLQTSLDELRSYYDRIFQDPAFYDESRDVYLKQNTPEVRAQRDQQKLQTERAQLAEERENLQMQQFVDRALTPTVQHLLQSNPLVSQTELVGRWTELTAPMLVRGRVPVQKLPELHRVLMDDLSSWVGAQQVERSSVKQKAQTQQHKANVQLTQAKRQIGRVLAPQGAVPSAATQKPTKFASADQWLKTSFGDPTDD